jgi:hypothetical protein
MTGKGNYEKVLLKGPKKLHEKGGARKVERT